MKFLAILLIIILTIIVCGCLGNPIETSFVESNSSTMGVFHLDRDGNFIGQYMILGNPPSITFNTSEGTKTISGGIIIVSERPLSEISIGQE